MGLSNQRLNARNPLSTAKGPYTQSQYGASLGGPLRRDRTFLFANFEQTRLNNATVVTILPANVTAIKLPDKSNFPVHRLPTGTTLRISGHTPQTTYILYDITVNL